MNISKKNYFDGNISKGFISLYIGKNIVNIATGFFGIFLPIFLLKILNGNLECALYYFFAGNLFYALTVALGAKSLNKIGFRRALRLSTLFGISCYVILYFLNEHNYWYILPISVLSTVLYRLSYWVPYDVDIAKFTDKNNRTRELGTLAATTDFIGIFIPIFSAFVITKFSFGALFVIAICTYLVSAIPYSFIPEANETFSWTYWETWKQFFSKKHRKEIIAFMAEGAEGGISGIIWPIFIYETLQGNILKVGIVSTLIVAFTVLLNLFVGKFADTKFKKKNILKYGSLFYSLGWFLKVFVVSAFQIFIVDAYHNLTRIVMQLPLDSLTFDIAADQGHYIDEFTVLFEMAQNLGRAIMILIILGLLSIISMHWMFILGAVAIVLVNSIRSSESFESARAQTGINLTSAN